MMGGMPINDYSDAIGTIKITGENESGTQSITLIVPIYMGDSVPIKTTVCDTIPREE